VQRVHRADGAVVEDGFSVQRGHSIIELSFLDQNYHYLDLGEYSRQEYALLHLN
jgi:hypothetical protein